MISTILTFLRHSLYPSKQALRLRLAPLHAYMGATVFFTILVTCIDYLFLQPDFFLPMWLFLHAIAVAFFYLLWVALIAIFVQLITRVHTKKAWPYRQTWPYSVAMTVIPTLILVILYQLNSSLLSVGFVLVLIYVTYPLLKIRQKKQHTTPS